MAERIVSRPLLARDGTLPSCIVKVLLLPAGSKLKRSFPTRSACKNFSGPVRVFHKQCRNHGQGSGFFVGLKVMHLLNGDGVRASRQSASRIGAHKLLPRKLSPGRIRTGRQYLSAIDPRRDGVLPSRVERGRMHGFIQGYRLPEGNMLLSGFSFGQSLNGRHRKLIWISNPGRRSVAHRSLFSRFVANPLRAPRLLQQSRLPPTDGTFRRWLALLIPHQNLPVIACRRSKRDSGIGNADRLFSGHASAVPHVRFAHGEQFWL